jgi:hypothetical protein
MSSLRRLIIKKRRTASMRIPTRQLDPTIKALFDEDSLPDDVVLDKRGNIVSPEEDEAPLSKWLSAETLRYRRDFLLKMDIQKRKRKY